MQSTQNSQRSGFAKATWIGLALSVLTVLFGNTVHAQEFRINAYTAYAFDDRFDSYYTNQSYYDGKIKGGLQWGGGLEFMMRPEYSVEVLYLRQSTHAPTEYATGPLNVEFTDFDLGINYILLGGTRHALAANDKLEGFGGLMAGMVIANLSNPDNGRESSVTKFAWGVRVGGIVWAAQAVGIKMQAQLLSAVQSMGGSFYFGSGGSGAGISTYSTIYQFTVGGGLVIRIGE